MSDTAERFTHLGLLSANWDSYGAPPIDKPTILRAETWLNGVSIVPCSSGGVQLEWHQNGLDMEVTFYPNGETEAWIEGLDAVRVRPSGGEPSR